MGAVGLPLALVAIAQLPAPSLQYAASAQGLAGNPQPAFTGPAAVSTARAERGDIDIRLDAIGTIVPVSTVTVKAPVSGVLVKAAFTEGQLVDTQKKIVSVRAVKVGVSDGDRDSITAGLAPGDTVAAEGGDRLHEGADVLLPGAAPPQLPATTATPENISSDHARGARVAVDAKD